MVRGRITIAIFGDFYKQRAGRMILLGWHEYLGLFIPWPNWASHDAQTSFIEGPRGKAKSETNSTSLNHQLLLKIRRLSFNNTTSVASGRSTKIDPRRVSLILCVGSLKRAALVIKITI